MGWEERHPRSERPCASDGLSMLAGATDTGRLTPVVQAVGWLVSAATAIGLTWRRRARWEPAEEDVGNGPGRVGGVLCTVALAVLWTAFADGRRRALLAGIAISLCVSGLTALLGYGYLIATRLYEVRVAAGPDGDVRRRIIGGSRLTAGAERQLSARPGLTVEDLLAGAADNPDLVWPRRSRMLAKTEFVAAYLALVACGTLALAAAAILIVISGRR